MQTAILRAIVVGRIDFDTSRGQCSPPYGTIGHDRGAASKARFPSIIASPPRHVPVQEEEIGMSRFLRAAVSFLLFTLTFVGTASARGGPDSGTRATDLLASLCKEHSDEPACSPQARLSEDDAWLILRTACRRDDAEPCRTFRQQMGPVLIFDARLGSWHAEWETDRNYPLSFDVAGTPTLRLKPGAARPLRVLVTDISPLMYLGRAGHAKRRGPAGSVGIEELSRSVRRRLSSSRTDTGLHGSGGSVRSDHERGAPESCPGRPPFARR